MGTEWYWEVSDEKRGWSGGRVASAKVEIHQTVKGTEEF